MKPVRSLIPVRVATSTAKQINLLSEACRECGAQFRLERGILARSNRKRTVEFGRMVGHCDMQLSQVG